MKDRIWSLLIVILLNGCLASDCIGDVDYVDAVTWGCTNITGHLNVPYVSGLIDLSELSALNFIGGDISIYGNPDLVSVNLEGLISVGGNFYVADNPMLREMYGFSNLTSVGGYLMIRNNDQLLQIDCFNALTYIGEYLSVHQNVNLTLLDGFDSLVTIETDFTIHENPELLELRNFSTLVTVGGYFSIRDCSFTQINGFESLTSVGRNLRFYNNDELVEINAFKSLESIGEYFSINDCLSLTRLAVLDSLTFVGGDFTIFNNDAWTELNNFPVLETIVGYIAIRDSSFTQINGFESLNFVGKDFAIYYNDELEQINAFESLTYVGEDLFVEFNNADMLVNGFGSLAHISGTVTVQTITTCAMQIMDTFNRLNYTLSGCSDIYCLKNSYGNSCVPCACEYPSLMTCDDGITGSGNCTCIELNCGYVETTVIAEVSTSIPIQTTEISDTTIPVKTTETQVQTTVTVETTVSTMECTGLRSCEIIEDKPVLITTSEKLQNAIYIFKNDTVVSGGMLEISNSEIRFNNLDLQQATLVLGSSVMTVENSMRISSSTMIVHLTSEEHESIKNSNLLLISTGEVIGKFDKVIVYVDDKEVSDVEIGYDDGIYLAQKKNDFSAVLITITVVVVLGISIGTIYYFKDVLFFAEDESPHFPDQETLELN